MLTPQASHSNSNTLLKFENANIGALVNFSLISSKALPALLVQTKASFFFKQCHVYYQATEVANEMPVESS